MKLFSWVQNKLNGKQGSNKNISPTYTREAKGEFSDWPQAFLFIGTLGTKDLKDDTKVQNHCNLETQELTSEEVTQLQKELNAMVSNCDLDSLATLEATKGERSVDGEEETHDQHKQHFATIASCNNKAIREKSVPFLLKKMFMCGAGFGPVQSLRDPMLSAPQTRMEKILRALLHKKIYPQNPSPPTSKKKYLASGHLANTNKDDHDQGNEGSKWVKTDTEYIVLEI